ncbi:MAG: FAD:protein FMN transferase [Synergistaceae bacterium]|jgi:thiamine biosynthesis lipoprotein|nr:FAD:protein FMN transferase [Synergistaceae bacterium]
MKKFLNFNTFVIICSILGIAGVFLIRRMDPFRSATREGVALDTLIRVTAGAAKPKAEIERILDGAFALVSESEKKFSMHDPNSEISAISAATGHEAIKTSDGTYAVLAAALHIARLTDGAFDPTMGSVSALWQKYLPDGKTPSDEEVSAALLRVGYDRLRLQAPDTVFLDQEGTLDLGGIAKGYVSEMVRDYLRKEGVTSALIDLGGNIVVMGGRAEMGEAERQPWNIGIQDPGNTSRTPICALILHEGSVITAGVYERYWEVGGHRYTHIFDPATGRPLEGSLKSVTIVSNDPTQGDALSTAFMVMGEERSLELLRAIPSCDAIFISDDGNGKHRILATSGLMDSLKPMPGGEPIYFYDIQ